MKMTTSTVQSMLMAQHMAESEEEPSLLAEEKEKRQ